MKILVTGGTGGILVGVIPGLLERGHRVRVLSRHADEDTRQSANWRSVVDNVVEASGGTSDGVQTESAKLSEEDAAQAAERIRSMIQSRQRTESATAERPAQR